MSNIKIFVLYGLVFVFPFIFACGSGVAGVIDKEEFVDIDKIDFNFYQLKIEMLNQDHFRPRINMLDIYSYHHLSGNSQWLGRLRYAEKPTVFHDFYFPTNQVITVPYRATEVFLHHSGGIGNVPNSRPLTIEEGIITVPTMDTLDTLACIHTLGGTPVATIGIQSYEFVQGIFGSATFMRLLWGAATPRCQL